jgi:hypothetical protein
VDELTTELTPRWSGRPWTPRLAHVDRLVADGRRAADPLDALQRRDEILQIMFWLFGRGLGPTWLPADIIRFVADEDHGACHPAAAGGGGLGRSGAG